MRHYETTFIVDPVLSGDEIKKTAQMYVDYLKGEGCSIIHFDEMGVREMAYSINKRSSGAYFFVEYKAKDGNFIAAMETAFRRDDNVLRYLTIKVDKHRAKYNEDKRAGKFEKKNEEEQDAEKETADAKK